MNVSILVKRLYIVFANAIGLWFVNGNGSPFCRVILLSIFSKRLVFVLVCSNV